MVVTTQPPGSSAQVQAAALNSLGFLVHEIKILPDVLPTSLVCHEGDTAVK